MWAGDGRDGAAFVLAYIYAVEGNTRPGVFDTGRVGGGGLLESLHDDGGVFGVLGGDGHVPGLVYGYPIMRGGESANTGGVSVGGEYGGVVVGVAGGLHDSNKERHTTGHEGF